MKRQPSSATIVTDVRVVDASALAALLFGEPAGEAIAKRLDNGRLVAPTLLGYELANVCVVKCRRYPEKREALLAAFGMRGWLGVEQVDVDHAAAATLALSTGLTLYDASYLWLARHLKAELVTLDRQLERAATRG
jgi:predicted nucleic acid-binding protein